MAVTIFGVAHNPTDNLAGGRELSTVSVTPVASVQAGDLVILHAHNKGGINNTYTISEASGQTWNALDELETGVSSGRTFWCQFNGTWGADPSVTGYDGAGSATSLGMVVFRPTTAVGLTWAVDVAQTSGTVAAAATLTFTGINTATDGAVAVFLITTLDDNTFGNLTGTGWAFAGGNQYRNQGGTDSSSTYLYRVMSTAGATGSVSIDELTNGNDAADWFKVAFKETFATPPTFDTSPTVSSQTASAYTISYDADANATNIYVGAYVKDATAPTASQLKAGTNAHGTATEATTGSADSIVLTPSDTPKFPLYDVYCCLEGPGGFSSVVALVDEFLDPPAGYQFEVLASVGALSHLNGTVAAAGDIEVIQTTTDQGHTVNIDSAGVVDIDYGGSDRQLILRDLYDVSTGAYDTTIQGTLVINNHAPLPVTTPLFPDGVVYEKDVAITNVDYDPLVTDEDGDDPDVSFVSGPTGLSFAADSLTGTPTAYQNTGNIVRWTDLYGDYYEESINFLIGAEAPDVVEETEANAITTIEALASFTVLQPSPTASHPTIPIGSVISQVPAATEIVAEDTEFTLTLSSGPAQGGGALSMINDFGFRI